ncbi:MAG TPA: sugar phosphate nucleotidyltransferase [Gemmatales bacterium]|nr:sugar phosphate nucleotidyltransferase [Gemmatales bacterium]
MIPAKVVIQAGGKGSRLYPYTKVLPKPLMPVGGMPILEIVVRQLAAQGFRDITISLGHLGDMIRLCCGDGSRWGVRIDYVTEDRPLGTIGPLKLVSGLERPFLVMNGDLLTDLDFAAFHRWHQSGNALLSIATYMKPVNVSLGVLEINDAQEVIGFREKPTLHFPCSMGVYAVNPELLDLVPAGELFGFDHLMYKMLELGLPARSYLFAGTWMDIGRPEDFHEACELFERQPELFLPPEPLRKAG